MTAITKLSVSHLRNLTSVALIPGARCNLIYGENGSGKSSLLEAIYLLGRGRSFRGNLQKPLIQQGESVCTVFAELSQGDTLGISKTLRGPQQIKISGKKAGNAAELAATLPLQLLSSDTFRLLEGSPKTRRTFMDWGVFHVEHRFIDAWRHAQRALQHRNNLIRHHASARELEPWSREYAKYGEVLDALRRDYVEKLSPLVMQLLEEIMPIPDFSLDYERGWDQEAEHLEDVLSASVDRDRRYGHTVPGPHRAELRLKVGNQLAVDILSRGQQKMLVSALKIAQGFLLQQVTGKACVYLADDLPAELDRGNREAVCRLLDRMGCQIFVTAVEKEAVTPLWPHNGENSIRLFHVKHGKISAMSE